MRKLFPVFLAISLFAFFTRCGGDGAGGPEAVGLKGKLNIFDYSITTASMRFFDKVWGAFFSLHGLWNVFFGRGVKAASVTVNAVWAVPMYGGEFHPSSMGQAKRVSVGSDGSFSIGVDKQDWAVVLVDTSKTGLDRIVGYVAMTAGTDGLQKMALSNASADSVDLGDLSKNGVETSSSRKASDNASVLNFTESQLIAMAKSDDTLRVVKNVFANYDESTGKYTTVKPFYLWKYSDAQNHIVNAYSDAATTVTRFNGFSYYFNSNSSALDFTRVCNQTDLITLTPPSAISDVTETYSFSSSSPISSSGSAQNGTSDSGTCGPGNPGQLYFRDDSGKYGDDHVFQFNFTIGGSYLKQPIPSGNWTLKTGSTTIATFDGQLGSPFQNDDSTKPIIFIPSVKATVASGIVSGIEVKWYLRNSSGSYEEVTDATLLSQMSSPMAEFSDYSGNGGTKSERGNLSSSWGYSPSQYRWAIPGQGSGTANATDIAITYQLNAVSYRFEHRSSQ
jgi:hypothetical protein